MGSLNNSYIEFILKANLVSIFMSKLIGLDKTKINDIINNPNKFSEAEVMRVSEYSVLEICAFSFDVKSKENIKKFTATIEISDKDKAFEKNTMEQKVEKKCNRSEVEKTIAISIQGLTKEEFENLVEENIEKTLLIPFLYKLITLNSDLK